MQNEKLRGTQSEQFKCLPHYKIDHEFSLTAFVVTMSIVVPAVIIICKVLGV